MTSAVSLSSFPGIEGDDDTAYDSTGLLHQVADARLH